MQSVVSHTFKNVIPGETRVQILKWASVGRRLYCAFDSSGPGHVAGDNWWLKVDLSVCKKWNLGDFFTQMHSVLWCRHALAKCLSFNHLALRTSFLSQVSFSCLLAPFTVTASYPSMPSYRKACSFLFISNRPACPVIQRKQENGEYYHHWYLEWSLHLPSQDLWTSRETSIKSIIKCIIFSWNTCVHL